MLIFFLICVLSGVLLGQHFKVVVLIPTLVFAMTASVGLAIADTFWQILGCVFLAISCLQIGYVTGVSIRYLTGASRIRERAEAASPLPRNTA
jgi:hypothetical protein